VESPVVALSQASDPSAPTVHFDRASSHVVRSLRQSQLLDAWLCHVTQRGALPAVKSFAVLRDYREPGELTFFQVLNQGGAPRYFVAQESTSFRVFFGASSQGRFLDEAVRPRSLQVGRTSLDECLRHALPVFAAFSMEVEENEQLICERLVLPFGAGRAHVTDIVTSLKTTAWSNRDVLFTRPGRQEPKYRFRAVIDPY
jgi:hypothetical protein